MRWGWNFFNLMVKDGKLLGRYVISENRKNRVGLRRPHGIVNGRKRLSLIKS